MARLGSESKGGFYPTPTKEIELILRRVKQEHDYPFSIFDPCAGTGTALLQIKNHFSNQDMVESYGIEIEKTRAYEAKRNVDHLLQCGYEDTRISHDTFSLMYLNPPFMQLKNERSEYRFFKDLTQSNNTLSTSALVILNVPQYTLAELSKIIVSRLEDIKVYRFTDDNYYDFKQVIVFGYLRGSQKNHQKNSTNKEHLIEYLTDISYRGPECLEPLDTEDDVCYVVPPQVKPTTIFASTIVTIDDVKNSSKEIRFLDKIFSLVDDVRLQNDHIQNPAMPLKITHQVQAIQSGALPEHMGDHCANCS